MVRSVFIDRRASVARRIADHHRPNGRQPGADRCGVVVRTNESAAPARSREPGRVTIARGLEHSWHWFRRRGVVRGAACPVDRPPSRAVEDFVEGGCGGVAYPGVSAHNSRRTPGSRRSDRLRGTRAREYRHKIRPIAANRRVLTRLCADTRAPTYLRDTRGVTTAPTGSGI